MSNDYVIKHTSTVIYAVMPDNTKAYLKYIVDNNVMELLETYTPPKYRGVGIGRRLVEYAIELARRNKWLIKPVCSYTISYFIKNPDKRDVLIPEYREKSSEELQKIFEEKLREETEKNK